MPTSEDAQVRSTEDARECGGRACCSRSTRRPPPSAASALFAIVTCVCSFVDILLLINWLAVAQVRRSPYVHPRLHKCRVTELNDLEARGSCALDTRTPIRKVYFGRVRLD
eukprot:scaffold16800_cov58-Phaeocystis_antarctica.AAC.2